MLIPPSRHDAESSIAPVTEAPLASDASTLQFVDLLGVERPLAEGHEDPLHDRRGRRRRCLEPHPYGKRGRCAHRA